MLFRNHASANRPYVHDLARALTEKSIHTGLERRNIRKRYKGLNRTCKSSAVNTHGPLAAEQMLSYSQSSAYRLLCRIKSTTGEGSVRLCGWWSQPGLTITSTMPRRAR